MSLLSSHAGHQASEDLIVAAAADSFCHLGDCGPEVGRTRADGRVRRNARKACRHHSDHSKWNSIELDAFANEARVAAEIRFPKAITQDYDIRTADAIFVGRKISSQRRLHTENVKIIRGNAQCSYALRLASARKIKSHRSIRRKVLERAVMLLEITELVIVEVVLRLALIRPLNGHNAIRL